jgi:hypothetical protein
MLFTLNIMLIMMSSCFFFFLVLLIFNSHDISSIFLPSNMTNCEENVVCVDKQMGGWWHCDLIVLMLLIHQVLTIYPPTQISLHTHSKK